MVRSAVRDKKMFKIGEHVSFVWGKEKKVGEIVGYEYDEGKGGNVWEVTVTSELHAYFSDDELTVAAD